MIEYLDIVDENDQPTGKLTTKKDAEANNILHRCAAIYVFDKNGHLIVQHHKKSTLFDHSVGGHPVAGEDYLSAAIREAEEELGIKGVELIEVDTGFYTDENFTHIHKWGLRPRHMFSIHEATVPDDWEFVPNDEVDTLYSAPIEDVVKAMNDNPHNFTPAFFFTMNRYLEFKKLPHRVDIERLKDEWDAKRNAKRRWIHEKV